VKGTGNGSIIICISNLKPYCVEQQSLLSKGTLLAPFEVRKVAEPEAFIHEELHLFSQAPGMALTGHLRKTASSDPCCSDHYSFPPQNRMVSSESNNTLQRQVQKLSNDMASEKALIANSNNNFSPVFDNLSSSSNSNRIAIE
jgi:hypothetical protein